MTANDIFQNSRIMQMRELKAANARLNEDLAQARAELDGLRSHFALALAAALDAAQLPPGGRIAIVDGWNALLGSACVLTREERRMATPAKRDRLCEIVRSWLNAHPQDRAWIVFDGARADGCLDGRLRISFTGGTGAHRADRMICDYLRMCRLSGAASSVLVFTEDAGFTREATSLGATVRPVGELATDSD